MGKKDYELNEDIDQGREMTISQNKNVKLGKPIILISILVVISIIIAILFPLLPDKTAIIYIPGIVGSEIFADSSFNSKEILGKDIDIKYTKGYKLWDPQSAEGKNSVEIFMNQKPIRNEIELLGCNEKGDPLAPTVAKDPDEKDSLYGSKNYYGEIMQSLKNNYLRNRDVEFFPYDWRMDNTDAANALEKFINSRGYNKVIIVAHSMGGLVASKYIEKSTKNKKKVEKLITIGTPYLGTPKALYILETGILFEDNKDKVISESIQSIAPNLSSLYQLLPTSEYFSLNHTKYMQKQVVNILGLKIGETELNYEETKAILNKREWALAADGKVKTFFADSDKFHNSLFKNGEHIVKSVDSYFIIGYGKDTVTQVIQKYNKEDKFKEAVDVKSKAGDGTVPLISANIGYTINSDKAYYIEEDHAKLSANKDVIDLVLNIINGKVSHSDNPKFSKEVSIKIN